MKKVMRTTLGRKLTAFYLIIIAVSLYFLAANGYDYICSKVETESQESLVQTAASLIRSHLNTPPYNEGELGNLRQQLDLVSEMTDCRVLILYRDGYLPLDTGNSQKRDGYYMGDKKSLSHKVTKNFTMNGYLESSSLCVSLPLPDFSHGGGFLILAQPDSYIYSRADYYYNMLMTLYYLIAGLLGVIFFCIYIFVFRPLRKLRNGVKDFSISGDNPTIEIHTNDEYGELADALNVIGTELGKFDEYQRKFISNISHDFRSPLTNIRGYVQAMADGVIPPEDMDKYLHTILFETDRLTKLTSDLLDLNKLDKDNIFLDISEFDIHESIRNTINSLEGTAARKKIHFRMIRESDERLLVSGDKEKIQQVLHNLMDNAVKFSHPDSDILIRTRTRGDKVFVSVKDSGIGIPKEDLGKIWDRFYKTDLSRGKDKLGTGLGLSISREIINAHRQTLDVVSTVGVGSKFIFTLPKAAE